MAAKRFSGKWTVRQTINKKHFIVHAYECIPGLQSALLYSWQILFFTLAPINLIFISSLSISFFSKLNEQSLWPILHQLFNLQLNLPSHSISKQKQESWSSDSFGRQKVLGVVTKYNLVQNWQVSTHRKYLFQYLLLLLIFSIKTCC